MPKNSFCIGINAIDVKLTNNSGYRRYVYVINRDTRGTEQRLYNGWLEPGAHYLSSLMGTQLELIGPAGTEMLRVDISDYRTSSSGNWATFYVQDCGGGYPPGGGYGEALLWARMYPYALPQGGKGTIILQTNVESRPNMTYYFEILNSWGELFKQFPATKRPYDQYQLTLHVGEKTKPGMLTYTAKLWLESGFVGERRNVATTQFSFQIVTPGSEPTPYEPGYPGYPEYPGYPGYPGYPEYPGSPGTPGYSWPPVWDPYSGSPYSGTPYSPTSPYTMPQYGTYPYGTGYQMGTKSERSIE
jgi:hypothetical protein